ncbi:MAG TPA: DUF2470 domain-containing protein, partial [Actinophytocola sp.]|nr:DUF2470 domain-containing protein [Actinophytocola sp.]
MTPSTPRPGERARTVAALGPATVLRAAERAAPLLHHVHPDGAVSLLFPADHALAAAARTEPAVIVEIVDLAPVPLREPVRGLLWITGRLRELTGARARAAAVRVAEARPDPRLLDLGHGAVLLRLEPVSLVLADAEGSNPVPLAEFGAATPDPFCAQEAGWLRHL